MSDKIEKQAIIKNVRLSFPKLFKAESIGASEPKFSANFLFSKDDPQLPIITAQMRAIAKDRWGNNLPKHLKFCLQDGNKKDYDGYQEQFFLTASSDLRPHVVDRTRTPVTESDRLIYAGCYVNAVVKFWTQDNQYGTRINAKLEGVQFFGHGEAFGDKPIDPMEVFEELDKPSDSSSTTERPGIDFNTAGGPNYTASEPEQGISNDDLPF